MKQLFIEIDEELKFLLNSGTKLSNGHGEVLYYFGSVMNPENALEQIRHNVCHHKALYHGIYGNYTILYRDEWGKWRIFQDLMGGQITPGRAPEPICPRLCACSGFIWGNWFSMTQWRMSSSITGCCADRIL